MNDNAQTEAQIYVEDWYSSIPLPPGIAGPPAPTVELKREFVNTVNFTYSSDVLNLGDPFAFRIANPGGRYREKFQRGANVKLMLKNPNVNGGRTTLKHDGIVVNRTLTGDMSGFHLDVQCADRGWHLRENDAPLWYILQGATLERLLKDTKFIDPSWGIKGLVTDNGTTALIRRGLNNSRAQAQIDLQALGTTVHIQVEPGDKIADLVNAYCRRIGRLFTVSPDGYMQVWTPDENKAALYSINLHADNRRTLNNVMSFAITEDISSIHTHVTCIGEIVGGNLQTDSTNQNATKRAGSFINWKALPFRHNKNYADGDIFGSTSAKKQALWAYNRGVYDSWTATYTVSKHHQGGNWWEADQYCTVHDSINGLDGDFYVSAVTYTRDESGDKTVVTLKKPNLLKASFGVFPRAPRVSVPTTTVTVARETDTSITATEVK